MTDTVPRVLVPYADFLEHRERRRETAAEVQRQNDRRTIDTEAVPAGVAPPLANEGAGAMPLTNEATHRTESQSPVQNAERIT